MLRTYSYITTPSLCWCVVPTKELDKVLKHGIKPNIKDLKDIPHHHGKIIYAVRAGDEEALQKLKELLQIDEDNYTVLKTAVPAYYCCSKESPQTYDEKVKCEKYGTPYQGIRFIPKKIKAKFIVSLEDKVSTAIEDAPSDNVADLPSSEQDNIMIKEKC